MNQAFQTTILFLTITIVSCKINKTTHINNDTAPTILIDATYIKDVKARIQKKDPTLILAFNKLILDATAALKKGPYTVTAKELLAPSGNKHDYASYSRYWWPNPSTANGLPYIRKDGETNPESQSLQKSDRPRIGALGHNVETLGLAYYFTNEKKYAQKAADLLRVWFLDSATRMNPNLNHAQCRPGHNQGSNSGILDGRVMTSAFDGSLLIASSNALSKTEHKKLKSWANEYYTWLTTNKMALQEAESKNNHGTFYDAQTLYFALYAGKEQDAKKIAQDFIDKRLTTQIKNDGSMPQEMARTRPLFYSIFNLHAMLIMAHLAQQVDVDIWKANDSHLRKALNYLAPYTDTSKKWPTPTLGEMDRTELYAVLQMANKAYPNSSYLKLAEKLPMSERLLQRSNLAFPLMR